MKIIPRNHTKHLIFKLVGKTFFEVYITLDRSESAVQDVKMRHRRMPLVKISLNF